MLIYYFLKRDLLGQRKHGQGTQLLSTPKETTRALPVHSPVSCDNISSSFCILRKKHAREYEITWITGSE